MSRCGRACHAFSNATDGETNDESRSCSVSQKDCVLDDRKMSTSASSNPASPDADFAHYLDIFNEVFRGSPWVSGEEVGALRREAIAGRNHALATVGGGAAGIGFVSSFGGVCEITRMATRPAFRRRGVAASAATFMLEDRFGSGDELAWLTASDIAAQALYATLGFIATGAHCFYTWSPCSPRPR
jgi:GNAT superfamily N-acetyltransferase